MTLLPLPFNLSYVNQTQLPSLCNHVDLVCLDLTGLGRTFLPVLIFTNVLLLGEIKLERESRKIIPRAIIFLKSVRDSSFFFFERIKFESHSLFGGMQIAGCFVPNKIRDNPST